jgi:hypothetical protein
MTDNAKTEKETAIPGPLLALGAWAVPGLGHLLQGKKARAALFFGSVMLLFWMGVILQGHFTFPNDPVESFALFKFISHLASGIHFLIALLFGINADAMAMKAKFSNEIGATCIYLAGILNILCILDTIAIARGRKD